MRKSIMAVTLVLAMMLMMTMTVFAADNKDWESEIDVLGAAVVNNTYYNNLQDAVDAANGGVVKLLKAPTAEIAVDGALSLDLNGFTATVNGGTLTLVDSGTNDGTEGGKAYGEFTVAQTVTEQDGISYVVLPGSDTKGGYYTANAVRVKVTKVSIRPASAGIYYTTDLKFNKNVVGAGAVYGVVLSTQDKPGVDFMTEENDSGSLVNLWTKGTPAKGADFQNVGRSCLVKNILSSDTEVTAEANAQRGATNIYANGYVKLTVDGKDVVIMAENTQEIVHSMKTVMQAFDEKLGEGSLDDATAQNLVAFYNDWQPAMDQWNLSNLDGYYHLQEDVLYLGRTYEKDGAQWFNWSASGFKVAFQGSGLTAKIASNAPNETNNAYLKVYVDDKEPIDILLGEKTQVVPLAEGLDPDVTHTVEVRKRNSPWRSSTSSTAGLVSLAVQNGKKLARPAVKEKLIEFVGDSLTVGYSAADGATSETKWSTKTEDGTKTYSKQVADAFGAEYMVTAISGRGVVMNNSGSSGYLLPEIYPELDIYNNPGKAYDFSLQPDVIVINLGTNDATNSNLDLDTFQTGVVSFINLVREKNPNAKIIWAYGLRTDKKTTEVAAAIQAAIKQVNDENVHYLALEATTLMHLNHPTAEGYTASGEALIAKIKDITDWAG